MSELSPQSQQSENTSDTKETPRWRRGVEAMSDWWYEHFGRPDKLEDDDEETDSFGRKRRPVKKWLRNLILGKTVEPESVTEEATANTKLPLFDLELTSTAQPIEESAEETDLSLPEPEALFAASDAPITNEIPELPELPIQERVTQDSELPVDVVMDTTATPIAETQPENITYADNHPNAGPALLAFAAAERIDHYRDKRQKKRADALAEHVKNLEKQQQETKEELKQEVAKQKQALAQKMSINTEAPVAIPAIEKIKPAVVEQVVEESKPKIPEQPKQSTPEAHTENKKPPETTVPPLEVPHFGSEKTQELLNLHLEKKASELILQQTEAAAEKNIAIEAQYEKRHEIKDEASASVNMPDFSFANQQPANNAPGQSKPTTQVANTSSSTTKTQPNVLQNQMYKNAIKSGIWGAVIVLILVLVLYALR